MDSKCKGCCAIIPPENATPCKFCKTLEQDKISVFCKRCTKKCDKCLVRGCKECIEVACSDCGIRLCVNCAGNESILCDCYGECSICGTDLSKGKPCTACKVRYCNSCISDSENRCKECGSKE